MMGRRVLPLIFVVLSFAQAEAKTIFSAGRVDGHTVETFEILRVDSKYQFVYFVSNRRARAVMTEEDVKAILTAESKLISFAPKATRCPTQFFGVIQNKGKTWCLNEMKKNTQPSNFLDMLKLAVIKYPGKILR